MLGNSQYFAIDSVSSNITTTEKLDREVICMDNIDEPCIQEIDVVVRPNSIEHFQMIKVQVMYISIPTIYLFVVLYLWTSLAVVVGFHLFNEFVSII